MDQKITVLVIGDPHFQVSNIPEMKLMIQNLVKVAQVLKPDFIVCLGDVLHRHETIHVSPLMLAEIFIENMAMLAPTYVLIGNHDRPNNSTFLTNEHPFNSLKRWPNVTIVDTSITTEHKGSKFTFVPYVPVGRFMEALENVDYKSSRCIFAHQEFYGAKMGGIQSENGDKWPLEYPLIISGHIHDYDRLQTNILYTGTPMQSSFGDNMVKTVSQFTFSNDGWNETRIDLGLTKKVIVTLRPDELAGFKHDPNKMTKIIIKGDESELKECLKKEEVKKLKQLGIAISYKAIPKSLNGFETLPKKEKYIKRLYDAVCHDQVQKKWFEELFGTEL